MRCLSHKIIVLWKNQSECNLLIMKYEMNEDDLTHCIWYDMFWLGGSEIVELINVARQNIVHGNIDRMSRGLDRFVCRKDVVGWKILYQPQDFLGGFEIYQDWKIKTEQLHPRYRSSTPILVWSVSFSKCCDNNRNYCQPLVPQVFFSSPAMSR